MEISNYQFMINDISYKKGASSTFLKSKIGLMGALI